MAITVGQQTKSKRRKQSSNKPAEESSTLRTCNLLRTVSGSLIRKLGICNFSRKRRKATNEVAASDVASSVIATSKRLPEGKGKLAAQPRKKLRVLPEADTPKPAGLHLLNRGLRDVKGRQVPQRIPGACVLKTLRDRPPSKRLQQQKVRVVHYCSQSGRSGLKKAEVAISQSRQEPVSPATPSNSGERAAARRSGGRISRSSAKDEDSAAAGKPVWGDVVRRRRSSLVAREIPVSTDFHIRNIRPSDFKPEQPAFHKAYPLAGPWEYFNDAAAEPPGPSPSGPATGLDKPAGTKVCAAWAGLLSSSQPRRPRHDAAVLQGAAVSNCSAPPGAQMSRLFVEQGQEQRVSEGTPKTRNSKTAKCRTVRRASRMQASR